MTSDPSAKTMPPLSSAAETAESPACRLHLATLETEGVVRCPVCHHVVPPEHIGYKLHCRRCGYLESCCNPI